MLKCAGNAPALCAKCGEATHLELLFAFGLGAGHHPAKVLHAFLPDHIVNWVQDDGAKVKFHLFLVIVQSLKEGHRSVVLPYWHVVTTSAGSVETKYGQWAPFIGADSYASMTAQARTVGYAV